MTRYIVSAGFDKDQNSVYLKFYNDESHQLEEWFDRAYKMYCLSNNEDSFYGVPITKISTVSKYDALNDVTVDLVKGNFLNPADIKKTHIPDDEWVEGMPKFWENHIKIHMGYIYDNNIKMGMPYNLINNQLIPHIEPDAEKRTAKLMEIFPEKTITQDLIKLF